MNLLILCVNSDPVRKPIISSLQGFRSDPIGFAGGEYLPLPRSKGGVFPFLFTSMGTPLLPADFHSETMGFLKIQETSSLFSIDTRALLPYTAFTKKSIISPFYQS
jgi:hypothetical protein